MDRDANLIGRKVAKLRYQRNWTQDTLVAKMQIRGCNITRDVLANIETKRCVATGKHIFYFAEVFVVDVAELFRS